MPDNQQIIPVLCVWSADGIFPWSITENGFFDGKICLCFCFFYVILQNIKRCVGVKALRMQFLNPFGFSLFFNFLVIRDFEDEFVRESMIVEFV